MKRVNIAIDGPSGAGKTSIARAIAKKRGYMYLDTGSLYRTIGLFAIRNDVASKDRDGIEKLLPKIKIELKYIGGIQHVMLNGEDVSDKIRSPLVSIYASDVSAMEGVRAFLLQLQRDMAGKHDCVLDGRDIGTVVLPDANVKIYLTATPQSRAQRRYKELMEKGEAVEYSDVLKDVIYRDQNDSTRAIAPLKRAPDAVVVDTTDLTLEEAIDKIDEIIGSI